MRIEAFMDYLFYAIAVAAVLLLVWMILTRLLGVGPPKLHSPAAVWGYIKEACAIFLHMRNVGWLLTGVLLSVYLFGLLFALLVIKAPPVKDVVDIMMNTRPGAVKYAANMLYAFPVVILDSAWKMCSAFLTAMYFPFIVIVAYLSNKWKDVPEHAKGRFTGNIHKLLVAGCAVGLLNIGLFVWYMSSINEVIKWDILAQTKTGIRLIVSSANYVFMLLAASIGEGMLLVTMYGLLDGIKTSLKDSFDATLRFLKSLYLFNMTYFALPVVLSYAYNYLTNSVNGMYGTSLFSFMSRAGMTGNGYLDFIITLCRTVFFLVPFIIVKDGLSLGEGAKKTLRTVFAAPVEYAVIFIIFGLLSWLGDGILRFVSQFIVLPLTLNYYAWHAFNALLPNILHIWISIFAFCVFAVFSRQKFLYEGKKPSLSV